MECPAAWICTDEAGVGAAKLRALVPQLISSITTSPVQCHSIVIAGENYHAERFMRTTAMEVVQKNTKASRPIHERMRAAVAVLDAFCGDRTGYISQLEYYVCEGPRHGVHVIAGRVIATGARHGSNDGVSLRPIFEYLHCADQADELLRSVNLCVDDSLCTPHNKEALNDVLQSLACLGFTEEEVSQLFSILTGIYALQFREEGRAASAFQVSEDGFATLVSAIHTRGEAERKEPRTPNYEPWLYCVSETGDELYPMLETTGISRLATTGYFPPMTHLWNPAADELCCSLQQALISYLLHRINKSLSFDMSEQTLAVAQCVRVTTLLTAYACVPSNYHDLRHSCAVDKVFEEWLFSRCPKAELPRPRNMAFLPAHDGDSALPDRMKTLYTTPSLLPALERYPLILKEGKYNSETMTNTLRGCDLSEQSIQESIAQEAVKTSSMPDIHALMCSSGLSLLRDAFSCDAPAFGRSSRDELSHFHDMLEYSLKTLGTALFVACPINETWPSWYERYVDQACVLSLPASIVAPLLRKNNDAAEECDQSLEPPAAMLSAELLAKILSYLSPEDLIRAASTCMQWQRAAVQFMTYDFNTDLEKSAPEVTSRSPSDDAPCVDPLDSDWAKFVAGGSEELLDSEVEELNGAIRQRCPGREISVYRSRVWMKSFEDVTALGTLIRGLQGRPFKWRRMVASASFDPPTLHPLAGATKLLLPLQPGMVVEVMKYNADTGWCKAYCAQTNSIGWAPVTTLSGMSGESGGGPVQ